MASASPPVLDRWFPSRKPLPEPRLRLFCLPFAGGSAAIYQPWSMALPTGVELCAVQLPGRERRLMEPAMKSLPALMDVLMPALTPLMDRPFALFGYSMGARIGLEVARTLKRQGGPKPLGFIAAAAPPPSHNDREPIHTLDDPGFIAKLREYDGTPEEVLQHKELLELILPTLRADFALAWSENGKDTAPLDIPLSVYAGKGDKHVGLDTMEHWREESTADVRIRHFEGGHFFIRTHGPPVLAAVREDLTRWMTAAQG
ncbi:thioesterase [Corallococcus sp. CA049B]|uniref:thioesterase II family protein n=1 Tax=Corallococcus sp. CA049B TaxID=2316730 RepID=UPI000EA29C1B|nr:alpha/beta fold hydrolase [Corallococcus sp. CA049B]NOJ96169.1 thioesterase [Corallococcus coralloides]RKG83424.1 thioesterase [Corallococcus sp. CA049B]